jgi:hypothetical protein
MTFAGACSSACHVMANEVEQQIEIEPSHRDECDGHGDHGHWRDSNERVHARPNASTQGASQRSVA